MLSTGKIESIVSGVKSLEAELACENPEMFMARMHLAAALVIAEGLQVVSDVGPAIDRAGARVGEAIDSHTLG